MPRLAISLNNITTTRLNNIMNAQDTLTYVLIAYSFWSMFWIMFNLTRYILVSAERDILAKQLDLCKLDLAINELQATSNSENEQTHMDTNQHALQDQLATSDETFDYVLADDITTTVELPVYDLPALPADLAQEIDNITIAKVFEEMNTNMHDYVVNRTEYLTSLTIRELKAMAKGKIKNYSRWTKAQLVEALV